MNLNTLHGGSGAVLALALILAVSTACQGSPTAARASSTAGSAIAAVQAIRAKATKPAAATAAPAATVAPSVAKTGSDTATPRTADRGQKAATETVITLDGSSISAEGKSVTVNGSKAIITSAGSYRLSGKLMDGQIVVDSPGKGEVRLVLDGVDIHNGSGAAIDVADADTVVIVLADGAKNTVSDGKTYVFKDQATTEPNATIFSTADFTITGAGSLTVDANYNDGIASKDGLTIESGAITVDAADDGIRGKDYLVIKDGVITVTSQGDALKADNAEDAAKGYIAIEGGAFKLTSAGGDAIQAHTNVTISDGEFTLTTGGGSGVRIDETVSAKGIKAGVDVVIDGGAFTIDTADDAVNSNATVTVNGGVFDIATGDDALHADAALTMNDGQVAVSRSYEGLESAVLTINGGDFEIVSSDDGLNVAGGKDGSGAAAGANQGGRPGRGGGARQDAFAASANRYLRINGGYIAVNSGGDGLDINGSVEMTDGVLIVQGPTANMNAPLDYDRGFKITGGYVLAVGSARMAQAPDESSSQLSFLGNFGSAQQAGALLHLQSSSGEELFTFAPAKPYQSVAFSSPELVDGGGYVLYIGGNAEGTPVNGLYETGGYTPGQEAGKFTLSGITTILGGRSR